MMSAISMMSLLLNLRRSTLLLSVIAVAVAATPRAIAQAPASATAQTPAPPTPGDNIRYGYVIHQSVDLGGHIADHSGSGAV